MQVPEHWPSATYSWSMLPSTDSSILSAALAMLFLIRVAVSFIEICQSWQPYRDRASFHLSTLEATYIKTFKPNLWKQKEFFYGLEITH